MDIVEGQIYEGPVSALGSEGPPMRWIVVSPFGKRHAHSLGDPLELHCMPLGILLQNIELGALTLVDSAPDHPVIRLQRAKEARRLHDTHMGLYGETLAGMLALLDAAVTDAQDYAPFLAGEILTLLDRSRHTETQIGEITHGVQRLIGAS